MKKYYIFALLMVVLQLTSFASEFDLRVLRNGNHSVSIYNQTQTNNVNYFQFAGLSGSSFLLTVKDLNTNQIIFNNYVTIPEGSTTKAELDLSYNLNILSTNYSNDTNLGTIGQVNYGGSNSTNAPIGYNSSNSNTCNHASSCSHQNYGHHNHQHGNNCANNSPGHTNNNAYFGQFLQNLKTESFDSNRLKSAKTYVHSTSLSADQINEIAKTFTFDSNRLEWAKYAYAHCFDKQNYFLLQNSFTFNSNYNDLMNYISNH